MSVDQALHRQVREQRLPAGQDQGLPQPPQATVAIFERVNELEFVVEHGADDQRVVRGAPHPMQQRRHQLGYASSRRRNVVDDSRSSYRYSAATIAAGVVQQSRHQYAVRAEQVALALRRPRLVAVVCLDCIPRFLNLARRSRGPVCPSSSVATCSSLRVLPSIAKEPRIERMRLMRRSRGSRAIPRASARPRPSPTCSTNDRISGVIRYGGASLMSGRAGC